MGDDTTTQGDDAAAASSTTTTARRKPWQGRGAPGGPGGSGGHGTDVAKVRKVVAQVVWGVCALFALILAVAVLLIALDANPGNDLVRWVIARADNVDLGFFDLSNPIKDFDDKKSEVQDVKTALFNYGIAAIVWLGIGKLLEKVVKP
jgi:hypothetical protein